MLTMALFSSALAADLPDVLADAANLKQVKKVCWIASNVYIDHQRNESLSNMLGFTAGMQFDFFTLLDENKLKFENNKANCSKDDHVFQIHAQAFSRQDGSYLYHINFDVIAISSQKLNYVSIWHNYGFGLTDTLKELEEGLHETTSAITDHLLTDDWQ